MNSVIDDYQVRRLAVELTDDRFGLADRTRPTAGEHPVNGSYFARYWPPVCGPTGMLLITALAEIHGEAVRRSPTGRTDVVEVNAQALAAAIGVGVEQMWRTATRLDRVSPVTVVDYPLTDDSTLTLMSIPKGWPTVKHTIAAKVDQGWTSGRVIVVTS